MHGQVLGDEAAATVKSLFGKVVAAVRWFAAWMDVASAEYRAQLRCMSSSAGFPTMKLHKRGLDRVVLYDHLRF